MIYCETAIYNSNYAETQSLKELIVAEGKIIDCVYVIKNNICVVAVITEPIYFISEIRRLTNAVALVISNNTDAENIYVTRDTDIYCDIIKLKKLKTDKEKIMLEEKIINKVTNRAYEND